jgi:hypothetical protein
MKEQLRGATTIYFPDYDLDWVLRVDAADMAVGGVLMQLKIHEGKEQWQPLAFVSRKFTDQAKRWDAPKKEAFALFWGVFSLAYYLRGKPFVLETDHRNWVYIEKSQVPMIIRWRIYLQSFQIVIRHIPGKENIVADWMSRMYKLRDSLNRLQTRRNDAIIINSEEENLQEFRRRGLKDKPNTVEPVPTYCDDDNIELTEPDIVSISDDDNDNTNNTNTHIYNNNNNNNNNANDIDIDNDNGIAVNNMVNDPTLHPPEFYLKQVHGDRSLHPGARKTWHRLNKCFPGHSIPMRFVE